MRKNKLSNKLLSNKDCNMMFKFLKFSIVSYIVYLVITLLAYYLLSNFINNSNHNPSEKDTHILYLQIFIGIFLIYQTFRHFAGYLLCL